MYLLQRFDQKGFGRLNAIIGVLNDTLNEFVCLVASTCYTYPEVLRAMSLPFHTIPSEGVPGRRFFPAELCVDQIEQYAEELLSQLFGYGDGYEATVQPHSGTQANQVAYNAVLKESDVVLSLSPDAGGHISHRVLIGRRNRAYHYGLSNAGIDYAQVEYLANLHRPKLIIAGSSSFPREIDFERFGTIAKNVGAFLHADLSHTAIFHISGHHRSAVPSADFISFNPMKNLRGPGGGVLIYRRSLRDKVASALFPGTQGGPIEEAMFAKVVGFHILLNSDYRQYADQLIRNARALATEIQRGGVRLVTGGTDSHIVLLDLRDTGITGIEAEKRCERNFLLANRNLVPGDAESARIASGLRLGSACITCLGAGESDAQQLGEAITASIFGKDDVAQDRVKEFKERWMKPLVTPVR